MEPGDNNNVGNNDVNNNNNDDGGGNVAGNIDNTANVRTALNQLRDARPEELLRAVGVNLSPEEWARVGVQMRGMMNNLNDLNGFHDLNHNNHNLNIGNVNGNGNLHHNNNVNLNNDNGNLNHDDDLNLNNIINNNHRNVNRIHFDDYIAGNLDPVIIGDNNLEFNNMHNEINNYFNNNNIGYFNGNNGINGINGGLPPDVNYLSITYMGDILNFDSPEDIFEFIKGKVGNLNNGINNNNIITNQKAVITEILSHGDVYSSSLDYAELMLPADDFQSGSNRILGLSYKVCAGDAIIEFNKQELGEFSSLLLSLAELENNNLRLECKGSDLRFMYALSGGGINPEDIKLLMLPHNLNRCLKLITKYSLTRALYNIQTIILASYVEYPEHINTFDAYPILCIKYHLDRCYGKLCKKMSKNARMLNNVMEYIAYSKRNGELNADFMFVMLMSTRHAKVCKGSKHGDVIPIYDNRNKRYMVRELFKKYGYNVRDNVVRPLRGYVV